MSGALPLYAKVELRAMTKKPRSFDKAVMMSSAIPSPKYSCSGSPLMFWNGKTAIDGLSGSASFPPDGAGTIGSLGSVPVQDHTKGSHRPCNVFELLVAQILEFILQLVAHLFICRTRQANPVRFGDTFQAGSNVDTVAHQVAVALLDDVADMDADAEFDAALGRHAGVALDHAVLHLDCAPHRVDHAAELDEGSVSGAFHHASGVHSDRRINEVAAERPQPRERPIFVRASQPAVSDDIGGQDRRKLAGLAHLAPPSLSDIAQTQGQGRFILEGVWLDCLQVVVVIAGILAVWIDARSYVAQQLDERSALLRFRRVG